jgi:hypothetical protein
MKAWMKFIFLIWVGILGFQPIAYAQDDSHPNPALDALMWGIDYFPYPEWQVTVQTEPSQVTSTWTTTEAYPAVVYYLQQFPFDLYSGRELSTLVDEAWMEQVMVNYDSWIELRRCTDREYLTVELQAASDQASYAVRYWMWWEDDTIKSVFAAFPGQGIRELNAIADHYFPDVARCE